MQHTVYMKRALLVAKKRLANGYIPVGAVLVMGKTIVADNSALQEGDEDSRNILDHGEVVALRRFFEKHPNADGSKLTLYCTFEPCLMCYATSMISGIKKIVYAYEDVMGGGTNAPLNKLTPFYAENAVQIIPGVCRDEALTLFKRFFENPDNDYAGTLLETYTRSAK